MNDEDRSEPPLLVAQQTMDQDARPSSSLVCNAYESDGGDTGPAASHQGPEQGNQTPTEQGAAATEQSAAMELDAEEDAEDAAEPAAAPEHRQQAADAVADEEVSEEQDEPTERPTYTDRFKATQIVWAEYGIYPHWPARVTSFDAQSGLIRVGRFTTL